MIIFYSNDCPKCRILKAKLDAVGIEYEVSTKFQPLIDKGFTGLPVLQVDDEFLDFNIALGYIINEGEKQNG